MADFATFGQELYFDESIRAIESFSDVHEPGHLSSKIAETLSHPSEATRLRVASKIVQRYFRPVNGTSGARPFLKMVRDAKSAAERLDLLYWRTARTDGIMTALAGEILYPYFVLNTLPKGYDESAFRLANTGTIFSVECLISRDFAIQYACDAWGFDSARTVILALRIMKQANVLDAVTVRVAERQVQGYYPQPHPVRVETFAYCLYEEFLGTAPTVSVDRIHNGDCVKLFLLGRLHVDSMLRTLEKMKLITFTTQTGGRHIKFTHTEMDSLVDSIT